MFQLILLFASSAQAKTWQEMACKDHPSKKYASFTCVNGRPVFDTVPPEEPVPATPAAPGDSAMTWPKRVAQVNTPIRPASPSSGGQAAARVTVTRVEPPPEPPPPVTLVMTTGDTQWSGGTTDPLIAMLDLESEAGILDCTQSPTWVSPDTIRITNATRYPGRITVDGQLVKVFDPIHRLETAITVDRGNQMRSPVLYPGETCYVEAPYKDPVFARRDGYRVIFTQAYSKGAAGFPIPLDDRLESLWSVRLYRGKSVLRTLRQGGAGMPVHFDHLDGL